MSLAFWLWSGGGSTSSADPPEGGCSREWILGEWILGEWAFAAPRIMILLLLVFETSAIFYVTRRYSIGTGGGDGSGSRGTKSCCKRCDGKEVDADRYEAALKKERAEITRLRAKVVKLKQKLGHGRTKSAALRDIQSLRKSRLEAIQNGEDTAISRQNHRWREQQQHQQRQRVESLTDNAQRQEDNLREGSKTSAPLETSLRESGPSRTIMPSSREASASLRTPFEKNVVNVNFTAVQDDASKTQTTRNVEMKEDDFLPPSRDDGASFEGSVYVTEQNRDSNIDGAHYLNPPSSTTTKRGASTTASLPLPSIGSRFSESKTGEEFHGCRSTDLEAPDRVSRVGKIELEQEFLLTTSNQTLEEEELTEERKLARRDELQQNQIIDGHSHLSHISSLSYLWGSGRLPGLLDGECSPTVPVDIAHPVFRGKHIIQVACAMGSRQALFLTAGGDVYRSGGEKSSDMFPAEGDPAETSVMVDWGGTVSAGPSNTEGSASRGRRRSDGQLEMKIREPRLVQDFAWERALQRCTIVSVACGEAHCCALADGGQVFSWGVAADGRLGLSKRFDGNEDSPKAVKVVMAPKAVISLLGVHIVDIQCGAAHTIAREAILCADETHWWQANKKLEFFGAGILRESRDAVKGGRLFSWGKGQHGRLGHGDVRNQPLPKEIKGISTIIASASKANVAKSRQSGINNRNGLASSIHAEGGMDPYVSSAAIVSVSCGWSFSVAATLGGSVLCWGRGRESQLGYMYTDDQYKPCILEDARFGCANSGMRPWAAHTVSCGHTHTLLLAERHPGSVLMAEGLNAAAISRPTAVFSWGFGEKGELGTASPHRPVPEQLSFPVLSPGDTVVSVTSGSLHCAAVTHFGHVYVWGCNRHGALGVRSANDVWTPLKVSLTKLRAAAGIENIKLLSRSGSTDKVINEAFPQKEKIRKVHPVQVSCGERCTLILCNKESLDNIDNTLKLKNPRIANNLDQNQDLDELDELNDYQRETSLLPTPVEMHSAIARWYSRRGIIDDQLGSDTALGAPSTKPGASRSSTLSQKRDKKDIRNLRRDSKIWRKDILPNWEKTLEAPSRKLLRQQCSSAKSVGVPPGLRRRVWPLLISNALRITPELFQMYRKRAQGRVWMQNHGSRDNIAVDGSSGDATPSRNYSESNIHQEHTYMSPQQNLAIGKESSLNLIDVDLSRTFPTLRLFGEEGAYHNRLREVLETYACYRPDLGYVQGMSYIAALMCLYMTDTYTAFRCLANVMVDSKTHFFAFFNLTSQKQDISSLPMLHEGSYLSRGSSPDEYYACFANVLADTSKSLSMRMRELSDSGLEPAAYLFNWLQTAYLRVLPLGIASRVWDLFLIDGTPYLFRVGVALLVIHKKWLKSSPFEECAKMLTNHPSKRFMWDAIDEALLFRTIEKTDLSKNVEQKLNRLTH